MSLKKITLLLALSMTQLAFGKAKIDAVDATVTDSQVKLTIQLNAATMAPVEFATREGLVQAELKNASVWPKIEKNVIRDERRHEVLAYQFDKDTARIRFTLGNSNTVIPVNSISSRQNGNVIEISFPLSANQETAGAAKFDESYLDQLIKEKTEVPAKVAEALANDNVKMAMASNEKSLPAKVSVDTKNQNSAGKNDFSLTPYVVKFAGFLILILGGLWGFVKIFKKGIFSKGKLGFLQADQSISVLNSTYIAPKRSLMLVRAYKQVFLISNTENGINLISEVQDVAEVLKQNESSITGTNFDLDFEESKERPKEFRLKDDLESDAVSVSLNNVATTQNQPVRQLTEQKRVSDQIKKKMKALKALQ